MDTTIHHRWLAGYCFMTLAVSLVLLYAGGFTTTIGAGMVFADWPLSNGSLNPPGWTTDQAMMAEHGHRLLGATVGTLCIILSVWMWRVEERRWLRLLSYTALGAVVFQGLLGGARVLLVNLDLANIHGVTAQLFICILTAVAVGSSCWWKRMDIPSEREDLESWRRLRSMGLGVILLTIVQLVLGSVIRHRGAGLSIPYFPNAAPDGSFLPIAWNWATRLHFAHRVVALLLLILLSFWVVSIIRSPLTCNAVKKLALAAFVVINLQVALGAGIIWSSRAPVETTLHVLNGAIFLSIGCAITFSFFKTTLETTFQHVSINPD